MEINADADSGEVPLAIINTLVDGNIVVLALSIMVLVLISALVSGSEVAYFSLTPKDKQLLFDGDSKRNRLILKLLERPRRLLSAILITNNFVNVGIILLSYLLTTKLFSTWDWNYLLFNSINISSNLVLLIINTVAITFLLVLFGEVMPKIYANHNNIKLASFMAPFLNIAIKITYPLGTVLVKSTQKIENMLSNSSTGNISLDEIDKAIDIAVVDRASEEDIKILKGIVKFGNITVKQIMKSRMDIVAADVSMTYTELVTFIQENGYSRIPIYNEDIDHIEGVLFIKDLINHINDENFKWQQILRQPLFVPENKQIDDLMKEFQEKRTHLAMVVDEYGGTSGIVTLEDIVEEVVGEIKDEFDEEREIKFKMINDNSYLFEGKTLLNDVCKMMNIDQTSFDGVKGEADSLAGLLIEISGNIPNVNEIVKYKKFDFTVIGIDKNRISEIKVNVLPKRDVED